MGRAERRGRERGEGEGDAGAVSEEEGGAEREAGGEMAEEARSETRRPRATVDEKADRKEGERGCRFLYRGQTHAASETKRGVNVYLFFLVVEKRREDRYNQ